MKFDSYSHYQKHYRTDYIINTIKQASRRNANNIRIDSMTTEPTLLEKTVIDNIRRIRQEKGISQLRLSIFSGTSASYIGLMETYKNIPKLSTIERIAEALNVPVLDLFTPNAKIAKEEDDTISAQKENARKQKIREHLKSEILNRMESNLDEILQLI